MWIIFQAIKIYWKTLFAFLYPIVLLPIFLVEDIKEYRCLYIILLMAGYYVSECIPSGITGFIPIVLGPVMGISDARDISACYFDETAMISIAGLILGLSIKESNLHRRIAVNVLLMLGSDIRLLHLVLMMSTFVLSMGTSNIATIALMCPIIEATLFELEETGTMIVYYKRNEIDPLTSKPYTREFWKPSRITIGFFLSAAYSATIGGIATAIGSGVNKAFKDIFKSEFPNSRGVPFHYWLSICPIMIIVKGLLVFLYMQMMYFGLGRPKSKDAQIVKLSAQDNDAIKEILSEKRAQMGWMSFREIYVLISFTAAIIVWLLKEPSIASGWGSQISNYADTKKHFKVGDSTAGFMVAIFLFIVPADLSFFKAFSRNPEKRPQTYSKPVLSWETVQTKMGWSTIPIVGSGFGLSLLTNESGLSALISNSLKGWIKEHHWFSSVCIGAAIGSSLSEVINNVAIAHILLPIFARIARNIRMNPYFVMYPVVLSCSHSFMLPVGTPPNAIVSSAAHIPTTQLALAGFGVNIICYVILITLFPLFALGINLRPNDFPKWAQ